MSPESDADLFSPPVDLPEMQRGEWLAISAFDPVAGPFLPGIEHVAYRPQRLALPTQAMALLAWPALCRCN